MIEKWVNAVPWIVAGLLALVGFVLLYRGGPLRVRRAAIEGDSLHCSKCSYDLRGLTLGGATRCPECGTPTDSAWRGIRRRRPGMVVAGVVLLLGAAGLTLPQSRRVWSEAYLVDDLPTAALQQIVRFNLLGYRPHAMSELSSRFNRRELTDDRVDALARLAMNCSFGRPHSDNLLAQYSAEPYPWIEASAARGRVTPAEFRECWANLIDFDVRLRERLPDGSPLAFEGRLRNELGGRGYCVDYRLVSLSFNGRPVTVSTGIPAEEEMGSCLGPSGSLAFWENAAISVGELGKLEEDNRLTFVIEAAVFRELPAAPSGSGSSSTTLFPSVPVAYAPEPLVTFEIRKDVAVRRLRLGAVAVRHDPHAERTASFQEYLAVVARPTGAGESLRLHVAGYTSGMPAGFSAALTVGGKTYPLQVSAPSVAEDGYRSDGYQHDLILWQPLPPGVAPSAEHPARLTLMPDPDHITLPDTAISDVMDLGRVEVDLVRFEVDDSCRPK